MDIKNNHEHLHEQNHHHPIEEMANHLSGEKHFKSSDTEQNETNDNATHGQETTHNDVAKQGMDHKALSHNNMDHAATGHTPVEHAAMQHEEHKEHTDHTGHEEMFRKRFWVSLLLTIPVLLYSEIIQQFFGFTMPAFPGSQWITPLFSIIVFAYGGIPFLQMALPELHNRQPGMMMLISLAISVSMIYSLATLVLPGQMPFFWELVTLIDIMLLGHWLEMRSVRQASGALNELAKLMPDTAERIYPDGQVETVAAINLQKNDLLLVRPGASVPADGQVEEGESDVNEAMITGESRPVKKTPGTKIIAGTINGDSSLRIRVTAIGDETTLAGIMRLVREAQQSKSPTQLLADKAAGWLFYIALSVAAITAAAWIIATGFNVDVIARVATVLVIACPHALGLAIPLVVAITTAMGAQNGILFRDRLAMEGARNINTIIFDKTGTLTRGEFGVVGMETSPDWEENKVLALAAAIEGDSEHTISRAIRKSAEERSVEMPSVSAFEAIKGRGVHAKWGEKDVYIGGPRLLEMLNLQLPTGFARFEQQANE